MIAQGEVKATDPTTLIPEIMRIRYLIITTFCLNVFCAGVSFDYATIRIMTRTWVLIGMICWRIWRRSLANRLETWGTTRRVFETVMQTGQSCVQVRPVSPDVCSAAIHCAVLVIIITLDWLNLNMFYAFVDIVSRAHVLTLHAILTVHDLTRTALAAPASPGAKLSTTAASSMVTDLLS